MFLKRGWVFGIVALVGILTAGPVSAHTPLCACYDNGDGSVTCEGGFSDGSSAAGVPMRVQDAGGRVLIRGKMDADSEFTFKKPSEAYMVIFDAGEGHTVQVDGESIAE